MQQFKIFFTELQEAFKQELINTGRLNKTAIMLLLLMPFIYTIIFGYTYAANVLNDIPVAVCDLQQSKISRTAIFNYDTSDRFNIVKHVNSLDELEACIKSGQAKVGLYIEPDLDKRIKTALPAEISILIDATNVVYGSAALVAAEEINMNLKVAGEQKILERLNYYPDKALNVAYPAAISLRILNNPTNSYTNFMLLGLVCNGIQISLYLYTADTFIKNRSRRWTFPTALLLGKTLAIGITSLTSFIFCLWLAHTIFAVPLRAPWYEFLSLLAAFELLFITLGIFFALAFGRAVNAIQETLLFIMPGLLYSGLSWPNEWIGSLPAYIRALFPITYLAIPLRDLSLQGYSVLLNNNIIALFTSAIILALIDYVLLRYRLGREAAI